jgi:hypothetical protein
MVDVESQSAAGTSIRINWECSADIRRKAIQSHAAEVLGELTEMSPSICDLVFELRKYFAGDDSGETGSQAVLSVILTYIPCNIRMKHCASAKKGGLVLAKELYEIWDPIRLDPSMISNKLIKVTRIPWAKFIAMATWSIVVTILPG